MVRTACAAAAVAAVFYGHQAQAHDSWISQHEFRDPASRQWCCDANDCKPLNYTPAFNGQGFVLESGEVIPVSRALPSEDEHYWACQYPPGQGKTRCFFIPQPGT